VLPAEAHRARRTPLGAAALIPAIAVLALIWAGCGDDEDAAAVPPEDTADLTFALDADGPGGKPARTRRLVCAPNVDPRYAGCDAVLDLPADPGAPTPPATACTEIYGGPDELTVTGDLRGDPIDATFTRANGCEIDRFDRFTPVLQKLFPGYTPGASLAP
jgi:hypothetical protein